VWFGRESGCAFGDYFYGFRLPLRSPERLLHCAGMTGGGLVVSGREGGCAFGDCFLWIPGFVPSGLCRNDGVDGADGGCMISRPTRIRSHGRGTLWEDGGGWWCGWVIRESGCAFGGLFFMGSGFRYAAQSGCSTAPE